MKILLCMIAIIISCSKEPVVTGYRLIYIDNGGKCISCIQMRKISEDVIYDKSIPDSLNLEFERVRMRGDRFNYLKTKKLGTANSLILSEVKDKKEVRLKAVRIEQTILTLNDPDFIKKQVVEEIINFVNTEKKTK